jgi:4a-hydroxytetrahydrobiopterin dehydratase
VAGMAQLLSTDEVATALTQLAGWTGDTSGIERSVKAPSFLAGIRIVDAVAEAAEKADHHPDIDIRWRTVTFRLSTHSAGGVTDKDVELARQIDEFAAGAE